MAITGIGNNYSNVYESVYGTQKNEVSDKKAGQTNGIDETTAIKTESAKKGSKEEYLKSLQKQVPYVKLGSGCGIDTKLGGKAVVDVSPMLLEKMQNDPEAEKTYTQLLKDIERAEKTGDAYYNALGGTVEHWSYWYVDENGKYYHYAYTRRDDKLSKKLREEAKKNAEDLIERTRENTRKKKEELSKRLKEMAEEADKAERNDMAKETGTAKETSMAKEIGTAKETGTAKSRTSGKTVQDELSYLSNQHSGFSFLAANYTQNMRYGSNATTNIAISPQFLKKMAKDPELEQEYESYFKGMKRLDEENIRTHEARGRHIVAQGWAIDKNGGISRWGISEPTNKRHYGQEMTDYANKIRKQALEKKQARAKLEEKHKAKAELKTVLEGSNKPKTELKMTWKETKTKSAESAGKEEQTELKEHFMKIGTDTYGNKFKGVYLMDEAEESRVAGQNEDKTAVGINLDVKL